MLSADVMLPNLVAFLTSEFTVSTGKNSSNMSSFDI